MKIGSSKQVHCVERRILDEVLCVGYYIHHHKTFLLVVIALCSPVRSRVVRCTKGRASRLISQMLIRG